MAAEFVQVTRHETTEFSFCAPCHLLVVYEQGRRREGDTLVEGLPPSTRRNLKGKLTFVPAGHEYYERSSGTPPLTVRQRRINPRRSPLGTGLQ